MALSGKAYHLVTYCVQQNDEVHTHNRLRIGYFLAQEFVSKDYHVFATARKILNMENLTSNPDHITALALDVISPELVLAVYDIVKPKCNGKVDMIFHNSGYRSLAVATEASYTESLRMLTTNFASVIELNPVFADVAIQAKGKVVFTSSLSGLMP
ncbi:NAD(P)-binding protein [Penicillium canescens]|nr:NAD(P)-binding protein [Penicillium canescens]